MWWGVCPLSHLLGLAWDSLDSIKTKVVHLKREAAENTSWKRKGSPHSEFHDACKLSSSLVLLLSFVLEAPYAALLLKRFHYILKQTVKSL